MPTAFELNLQKDVWDLTWLNSLYHWGLALSVIRTPPAPEAPPPKSQSPVTPEMPPVLPPQIPEPVMPPNLTQPQVSQVPPTLLLTVTAVAVISLALMIAIVLITVLNPAGNNAAVITTLVGATVPTLVGLLAFIKSSQAASTTQQAVGAIQEVHYSLNSRLTEWMKQNQQAASAAEIAAYAAGKAEILNAIAIAKIDNTPIIVPPK